MSRKIQELVAVLGRCTSDEYCNYHLKKRNNLGYKLPVFYEQTDTFFIDIEPNEDLIFAVKSLDSDIQVAGSWQLVGEQREWFLQRLSQAKSSYREEVNFAILGVASASHLVETTKLILSIFNDIKVNFFVLDCCIKPLLDIKEYLESCDFFPFSKSSRILVEDVVGQLTKGLISYYLVPVDLSLKSPFLPSCIDFATSHFTFHYLNGEQAAQLVENAARYLKNGAHFIIAQEEMPYMHNNTVQYFENFGFQTIDTGRSWGIYELSREQREAVFRRETITVKNEDYLLDLIKL